MDWTTLDWHTLDRLRDGFISGTAANGPYWRTTSDLFNYNLTYAERIGWKWDAVLAELTRRQWTPPKGPLLDWGCGSGIAGRRTLAALGVENFTSLSVWDHSGLARDFAAAEARKTFPSLSVNVFDPHAEDSPIGTLVLSHVLNELSPDARRELAALARRADAVIWIEPGTHAASRDLATMRAVLRQHIEIVAPCTHAAECPLFEEANARHWCHFFAAAPTGIYADPNWVKFGQRAGVDLRSLPYSYLVFEKLGLRTPVAPVPPESSRLIGRARVHKAHVDLMGCDATGLHDLKLPKRAAPALHKQLDKKPPIPVYQWRREGATITAIETMFP